jgi:MoxR-like ATPase
MPADITGTTAMVRAADGGTALEFRPGPIFAHIVLADEINRATPKTQSALLEAMQEHAVTISGERRELEEPFFVIATQNPVDFQGTYPLPEAQLDRFLVRMRVGYPPEADELQMLTDRKLTDPLEEIEAVATGEQIRELQDAVRRVEVREPVARYLLRLVQATRDHGELELGISPRGSLALYRASQARAALSGRGYVSPEDVQALAVPALAHRVLATQRARFGGSQREAIIQGIVESVSVPT